MTDTIWHEFNIQINMSKSIKPQTRWGCKLQPEDLWLEYLFTLSFSSGMEQKFSKEGQRPKQWHWSLNGSLNPREESQWLCSSHSAAWRTSSECAVFWKGEQHNVATHVTKGECKHRVNLPPSEQPHEPKRCIQASPSGKQHNNPKNYSWKQKEKVMVRTWRQEW